MASTGVSVADNAISQFNEFKKQSSPLRYMIFKIDNGAIVSELQSENADFQEFLSHLPADDCRYAVYKMAFTTTDGRPNEKLVSISWAPDTAKVKSKMVYAGSKDALTRVLVGISVKLNATDSSELTEVIVQEACRKFN